MHGRNRSKHKALQKDSKVQATLASKAATWHAIVEDIRQRRRNSNATGIITVDNDESTPTAGTTQETTTTTTTTTKATTTATEAATTLTLNEQLLLVNPDPLYLWNHRRELLLSLLQSRSMYDDGIMLNELRVTEAALRNNPKSYGAWFHRKWCWNIHLIQHQSKQHYNETATIGMLQQELTWIAGGLQVDERNFHAWSYRRFVVSCLFGCYVKGTVQPVSSTSSTITESHENNSAPLRFDGSWPLVINSMSGTAFTVDIQGNESMWNDSTATAIMGTQIAVTLPTMLVRVAAHELLAMSRTEEEENRFAMLLLLQSEWGFTTSKIRDNFSNFSAFHYRSKLLPLMMMVAVTETTTTTETQHEQCNAHDLWLSELELVEQAIFTEPDDQTAWWYQRFLLDMFSQQQQQQDESVEQRVNASLGEQQQQQREERLHAHVANLRELAAEQATSKWVWLSILEILERLHPVGSRQERIDILKSLIQLDHYRKERYRWMLQKLS